MSDPAWANQQWESMRARNLGLTIPVSEVLDPDLWRSRFAFGLPVGASPDAQTLTPLEGALCDIGTTQGVNVKALLKTAREKSGAMPDETIRWHLRAALSELEVKLGVPMGVQIVKTPPIDEGLIKGVHYDRVGQGLPYLRGDLFNWYKLNAPEGSLISVERIRGYWFDTQVFEFTNSAHNPGLIHLEWPTTGSIHILPVELQGLLVSSGMDGAGTYGMWHTLSLHSSALPNFWRMDYTVGPVSKDGTPGHIQLVLAQWVYAVAGKTLLSMSGLATSKGLTSASISMDGVSRSVGLQASAIYGINSALEKVMEDIEKRIDWKRIKRYMRGMTVLPYGH